MRRGVTVLFSISISILASALAGAPRADAASSCRDAVKLREALNETIRQEEHWATLWGWGWAGLTAGQLIAAQITTSTAYKEDFYVGSAGSVLGVFPTLIVRPKAYRYRELAAGTGTACADGEQLQAALDDVASEERFMRGPLAHVTNILINSGIALGLAFGYHHYPTAIASFLVGVPLGELFVLAKPDYAERYATGATASAGSRWPRISLSVRDGSAALSLSLFL